MPRLSALEREKNRRQKDMLRKRRVRGHIRGQQMTEKEREGKEDIPPTPPIEEREGEIKRIIIIIIRACAREIPSNEEIAAECQRIGSDIDPEYFHDLYESSKDGLGPRMNTFSAATTLFAVGKQVRPIFPLVDSQIAE